MVIVNIDTAKDSPDEIRKTITYLQMLVDERTAESVSQAPSNPDTVLPNAPEQQLPFGVEIFDDEQRSVSHLEEDATDVAKPFPKRPDAKKPEAERLLEEAEEIEVVDENAGAFIEIVDMDEG